MRSLYKKIAIINQTAHMPMKCSTYLDEQKAKNDVLIHHEAFKR